MFGFVGYSRDILGDVLAQLDFDSTCVNLVADLRWPERSARTKVIQSLSSAHVGWNIFAIYLHQSCQFSH